MNGSETEDEEGALDELISGMKLAECKNCNIKFKPNEGFRNLYKHLVNEILKWKAK